MILRKFKQGTSTAISPIWHVVLADLMTNLTLFFLIMYGMTRLNEEKRNEMLGALSSSVNRQVKIETKAKQVLEKMRDQDVASKVTKLSQQGQLDQYVKFDIDEQMIKITLRSPVLFNIGDAELRPEMTKILNEVTPLLKSIQNDVIVEGHTDNVPVKSGKYTSNWELSAARASKVIEYFVNNKKLDTNRFIAAGYGEFIPLYPNDTPENRALNRRIEINIIK